AAGAGVVDKNRGDFVEVVLMGLYVHFRTDQALLFAGEENEANGALGLEVELGECASGFKNGGGTGAVVGGAGAEIPGIEVGAKDDDLLGLFGAANLGDGVVDLHLVVAELVGHFDFDLHRAMLDEAEEQAVAFSSDERG